MISTALFAEGFEVDGICYSQFGLPRDLTVKVTYKSMVDYSSFNKVYNSVNPYVGEVIIPSTVDYMGYTFNVVSIGDNAFNGCSGLTSVTIPDSITSIESSAFSGCSGLRSVTFGNGVTKIGPYAFNGCSGLTSVTIPDCVNKIGDSAFSGCGGLTSVTIGNGVTEIGDYAFEGCGGLTSVTIPDCVNKIGGSAFFGCGGLTSVTIGNGVTKIGSHAFSSCSGLTSVTMGNSVKSIDDFAFRRCNKLASIIIPSSVTSIGDEAFSECKSLHTAIIEDGVKRIAKAMFFWCDNLQTVVIGNSVNKIGDDAFTCCYKLQHIYCYAEQVPDAVYGYRGTGAFEDVNLGKVTLHVPSTSVDAYKAAMPWMIFKDIVALTDNDNPSTDTDNDNPSTDIDDDNPSNYKSLDDYIGTSSTTLKNYSYTISPIINNIKKVYVDLTKGTTNSAYCYLGIKNDENTKIIDFSSKYVSTSSDNFIVYENNNTMRSNIKKLVDNKTYSWLYYNPKNSNEVIIDVEALFGCLGFINGWQQNFGTSFIVNIVTESTETSIIPIINDSRDIYYNLQGQRVLNPKNGIYIKNGKKVFIK